MSTILENPVRVNRIVTTSSSHARAIDDPARARIMEILYRRALSAEQITRELKKSGHKKAVTTVRHHLDILKGSGLIEVSRIDESRGAITKFYSTSTKLLSYDAPKDFDSRYSKAIDSASAKLAKVIKGIKIDAPKGKRGKHETPEAYLQYLTMEVVNRAMTNVLENREVGGKT